MYTIDYPTWCDLDAGKDAAVECLCIGHFFVIACIACRVNHISLSDIATQDDT